MTVLVYAPTACLAHDPGDHPECPERFRVCKAALERAARRGHIELRESRRATKADLLLTHRASYVDAIERVARDGGGRLDADTVMSAGSYDAALAASGAALEAVDAVLRGDAERAFCLVRPPGHHALAELPMGFCLFNNVAVAAQHARSQHGLARIAVADFDVHHGNGTQAAFWDDPMLFFASSHQSPLYPGSGERHERGVANNIANAPLAPGSGSREFRHAWERDLLPAIDAFGPDLLIVSAGFDAHAADPLAQMRLDATDYAWLTGELVALAGRHCGGKIVSSLEGGYDLAALAESVVAHVKALDRPAD